MDKEALVGSLCRTLLLCMCLGRLLELLLLGLLCWVVLMALVSIVERMRLWSTLMLPLLLLLLLRVITRKSAHSFVYECTQIASVRVVSQLTH